MYIATLRTKATGTTTSADTFNQALHFLDDAMEGRTDVCEALILEGADDGAGDCKVVASLRTVR